MRYAVAIHRRRQSDVEVQVKRPRDFLGEVPAQCASLWVDVADEFGLVPTKRDGVVAMPGARRPSRRLRRDLRRQPSGGCEVGQCQRRFDKRQSCLVAEQLPHIKSAAAAGAAAQGVSEEIGYVPDLGLSEDVFAGPQVSGLQSGVQADANPLLRLFQRRVG